MKLPPWLAALGVAAGSAYGQAPYKLPPQEVVDILDAPPTPLVAPSPTREALLLVGYEAYPPIALLARPLLRLGGIRIDPQLGAVQRTLRYTELWVQALPAGERRRVELPAGAAIGRPSWSPDGKRFAFTRDLDDGVELWIGDAEGARAQAVPGLRVNDVSGLGLEWVGSRRLLVPTVPEGRGPAPAAPGVPIGPNVRETSGKTSQMATFQDLLETPHDAALLEHYATAQLALLDLDSGESHSIGAPGFFLDASFSPDERFLLVTRLEAPFSYRVPYYYFARAIEVWDRSGARVRVVAELAVSDEVPRQGVASGPRGVRWQMLRPATLLWVEALDGGDPTRVVAHRDRLLRLASPFDAKPEAVLDVVHRFAGLDWTARENEVLLSEYDRDRRWRTTELVNLAAPARGRRTLFDLSANDAYGDPGDPVYETRPDGQRVLVQDGDWIYLAGSGDGEQGQRPFLDRLDLGTLRVERLFQSPETRLDAFAGFAKGDRGRILLRSESPGDPPNYALHRLDGSEPDLRVTSFPDPAPQLAGVHKELIRYRRADGVPLSGTLYLPAGYRKGTRLPALIWAYPAEYSDPRTAGQVRAAPSAFSRPSGASPLFFLTQGYAVLMDATMPVVGDSETMNDTYVEQIVAAARAAVDALDERQVADRRRIAIAGHSYGAFMTANLLAHCDLFAAGIARSGAYNRSLTPFGFQAERRSFWDVPELYMKLSPFTYAPKIRRPLLLIHGEADNNSGTFPEQSERLYQAIQGSGGTARLVLLPHESHGYRARESVLHSLAEMLEWADRFVKNRPDEARPVSPG